MKKQGLCILKMNHFEYNYRYESFIAKKEKYYAFRGVSRRNREKNHERKDW